MFYETNFYNSPTEAAIAYVKELEKKDKPTNKRTQLFDFQEGHRNGFRLENLLLTT